MKKKILLLMSIALLGMATGVQAQVPNYVPTNGLVGWWPFTGNANDLSGNGNNGTVSGAILTTDRLGNAGGAYSFNGNSAFVSVPNSGSLQNISTISISAWVNINAWYNSGGGQYFPIMHKSDQAGQYGLYSVALQSSGGIYHLGSCETGLAYNNWTLNTWKHIVVTIASTSTNVYVDGLLVASTACGVFPQSFINTLPLIFGMDKPGLLEYANGKLDDIGIWNRALTQQEVTNLYNSTTNACPLITSITLNAQQTQSSVTNTVVGYLPNSTKIISDTTQWHYIALTKSGTTGNFYFDGALVTSSSFANNPYIWNSLLLGATQGCVSCSPVADFNGLIDEVRVSNIARTSSNIATAYSANIPFTADANTIGLFHLDNISANTVTNTIGGTAATFGTPSIVSGKFGQAISFDGLDDYVRWSNSIPVNNMTVEFWVKSSDQSATMAMLEYAYNTGIYLQSSTVTNPILWSTGDTTSSITVNPTQLPYVWVSNGSCSDTVFFNSQSATHYDTLTTTIYDTVTTFLSVTDTLVINVSLTGIAPPNNQNLVKAYPNPTSDHLLVDFGNYTAMSGYTLKITNTIGQAVYNQPITQQITNIDLSTWGGAGTYILYVLDAQMAVKSIKEVVLQ